MRTLLLMLAIATPTALQGRWTFWLPAEEEATYRRVSHGGRYVLDSVKGADLGTEGGRLVFDFNFAYNPSCSYDSRWACPLCPPPNRLSIPIRAGERIS